MLWYGFKYGFCIFGLFSCGWLHRHILVYGTIASTHSCLRLCCSMVWALCSQPFLLPPWFGWPPSCEFVTAKHILNNFQKKFKIIYLQFLCPFPFLYFGEIEILKWLDFTKEPPMLVYSPPIENIEDSAYYPGLLPRARVHPGPDSFEVWHYHHLFTVSDTQACFSHASLCSYWLLHHSTLPPFTLH